MKIHLYVLLFTVVFIHHSKCTESNTNESVTTPPVPGSSQPPSVEVPSTIIQRASFRERLHQFQASILKNSNISTQDLTELSKLINADPFDVDVIQWKLDEFNLKVKFSDDEIKHFASLFLYAMHEIIKQKGSTVVTTTPTNGPTPSTNSETSEQQSTPSKSPKTEQKVPKPDASSDTQVSEVLCVSVEQCKSLASQALWDEALQKCNDANPGEVVGEDDLIQYFESVMKAFNNVMKVSDFESSLKVVIAEPLTVVKDTPPSDTADNEQTQKNGNGHKTENSSDQTAENGSDQNDKMKRGEDLGNSNGQVTVETSHSSVIEEILPPKEESDIDDITTCSPYIKLSEGKQVSVSMYIYIKNNNKECLDSDLNLALDGNSNKPSSFLTKALSRDDRKSDTVLCREFVELFKLVDLAGLTQRMCDEQVLHSVSHAPFCTAPLPSEDDLPSLVDVFTKDKLFKIAAAFQFLIQLHTKPGECDRVCGGSDNAFCNAFVNLTLFFVEQTRKDRRPPPPTQQAPTSYSYRSLLKQVNTALMRPRTALTDLEDIQGSLDSPRLLNNTLTQIFPMMTERHLAAIKDNLEIVRFIVRKAIYRQRLHSHTTPGPTTKSIKNYPTNSPSFGDKGGNKRTLGDTENDSDYNFVNWGLNRHDSTKHQVGGDGEYQSDHNNDDVTYWHEQNDQLPERIDGQARIDQLTDHKDHLIAGLKHKDELKPQTIVNDEEQGGGDGQQQTIPVDHKDDDDRFDEIFSEEGDEFEEGLETQLLKEKDEDKQPPGQLSEDLLL